MTLHPRLMLALVIAVAGLSTAGFSVWRTLGKSPKPKQAVPEPTRPDVLAALSSTRLDTRPTPESVGAVIDSAVASAATAIAAAAGIDRPADLAQAFRIQLAAVLDGDYHRHRAALAPRGMNLTDAPEGAAVWNSAAASTRLAPLGLKALVVRTIYRDGRRVAPSPAGQGFESTEFRLNLTNSTLPESPERSGLTIVEVQLPMEFPTDTPGGQGARMIALTGFRFVWHAGSRTWLPWSVFLLHEPSVSSTYVPM